MLALWGVYRQVAVPMRRLGEHVRASAALTPPEPVPVSGPAEVAALGDDVNGLISSVGDELARRRKAEESALQAERQLRQAQKMEAVGQLAGGVAHDFNNLLTVIAGYSGIARNRIGAGPGAKEIAEIDHATERATQLTRQLLAFSRQQVLEPTVLDVNEVIEAVMPMLARLIGEAIEIGVVAGDELPYVFADRGQLEQVIVNLVVNARDAMPGGGTITIDTRSVRLDTRYAAEHAGVEAGRYACLSVTDTGSGMDSETQSRIFESFFTTKGDVGGTGLGLATVHGIARQSGGYVELYSEPGLGTSFKVYIPATAGTPATLERSPAVRPESLTGTETLLVCEGRRVRSDPPRDDPHRERLPDPRRVPCGRGARARRSEQGRDRCARHRHRDAAHVRARPDRAVARVAAARASHSSLRLLGRSPEGADASGGYRLPAEVVRRRDAAPAAAITARRRARGQAPGPPARLG
jgi:signal transduction histidine kinase